MKRIGLIATIAATLCTSTTMTQAHGCGGGLFWPFLAFGLTVAAVEASSHSQAVYTYYEPGYAYSAPPVYTSAPAQNYSSPPQPSPVPVAEVRPWTPSTPGSGQWVPDPHPYFYAPPAAVQKFAKLGSRRRKPAGTNRTQTVTISRTAGGVPLYINSR